MVTVASATLWITQQLDAWVPAVQAVALLYSLVRRTRPHPWQRSAIALNLGMLGIVSATIGVALRGEPSTIALAHFASLTQGLQLLDARPRRTEFLLVALALFQVVLAANLTDSVFFTLLLVVFVFATVWTLVVHTLHSEAVEAGHVRELSRAITPGLVRTTILASGLSVLLAGVLFLTLPRLRSSVVTGSQLGPALATAGFSDTVAFGALGRIRQDSTVVLRVETLEGREPDLNSAYWRGLAFDTFDGISWSVQPPDRTLVPGSAEMGVTLGREREGTSRVQRIVREPVAGSVLFALGDVHALQGSIRRLERDSSRGLYAAGQADERVRYTIQTRHREWRDDELRRDRVVAPRGQRERYSQSRPLPETLASLARAITRDAETDADRVRAIEAHLLTHGRYSDTPPPPDSDSMLSPVERFLSGDMAGHCEYFASAMVLLARELEIPARLVNGPHAAGPARTPGRGAFVLREPAGARQRARAVVVPACRGLRPLRPDRGAPGRLARLEGRGRGWRRWGRAFPTLPHRLRHGRQSAVARGCHRRQLRPAPGWHGHLAAAKAAGKGRPSLRVCECPAGAGTSRPGARPLHHGAGLRGRGWHGPASRRRRGLLEPDRDLPGRALRGARGRPEQGRPRRAP
jgi:hypothetical protein